MSALARMTELGAVYREHGKAQPALKILKDHGANLIRLRIFNDPFDEKGKEYGAGICDLTYLKKNVQLCKQQQLDWLLDFHYSDCWADPGKQTLPKAWQNLPKEALIQALYDFTYQTLKALDYPPKMVQIGNEITNGLCWPIGHTDHFETLTALVNAGIQAVRDFDPNITVMVHLDNGTNNTMYHHWLDRYFANGGLPFDLLGMSYYPIWNDTLVVLKQSVADLIDSYHIPIVLAETAYPFSREDYFEDLPQNQRKGMALKPEHLARMPYPVTPKGQSDYFKALMKLIRETDQWEGFIYWGSELTPFAGSGWASYEGIAYMHEKGPLGNEWANQAVFDYQGEALDVLKTIQSN